MLLLHYAVGFITGFITNMLVYELLAFDYYIVILHIVINNGACVIFSHDLMRTVIYKISGTCDFCARSKYFTSVRFPFCWKEKRQKDDSIKIHER